MLFQHNNCEFSSLANGYGKACLAGNGRTLIKRHNAVCWRWQANPKDVPVVSRSRVAALAKGMAIAFAPRPAAKHHQHAESVIIMLKEH